MISRDSMKAIVYRKYGPPSVLNLARVPKPAPRSNEVLIRVAAAEATKADCEMRGFKFSVKWFWLPLRLAFGVFRPRRSILGGYLSGTVSAIGEDVTEYQVGDQVYGSTGLSLGGYGEYVALPASSTLTEIPSNMSFPEAAAVPLGGLNALHFMRRAEIEVGDEVLVIGGGGSIGAHAVQIAKAMGATVTAVDSATKSQYLIGMGADRVIDYRKASFADGKMYDVIFDMVPTTSYTQCMRALRPRGRYLCGNPRLSIMFRSFLTNRFSSRRAIFAFARESQDELSDLTQMIEREQVRSIVGQVLPLEEAAQAHELVETEQRVGAVVLVFEFSRTDAQA